MVDTGDDDDADDDDGGGRSDDVEKSAFEFDPLLSRNGDRLSRCADEEFVKLKYEFQKRRNEICSCYLSNIG